jgi:hypothetical protein
MRRRVRIRNRRKKEMRFLKILLFAMLGALTLAGVSFAGLQCSEVTGYKCGVSQLPCQVNIEDLNFTPFHPGNGPFTANRNYRVQYKYPRSYFCPNVVAIRSFHAVTSTMVPSPGFSEPALPGSYVRLYAQPSLGCLSYHYDNNIAGPQYLIQEIASGPFTVKAGPPPSLSEFSNGGDRPEKEISDLTGQPCILLEMTQFPNPPPGTFPEIVLDDVAANAGANWDLLVDIKIMIDPANPDFDYVYWQHSAYDPYSTPCQNSPEGTFPYDISGPWDTDALFVSQSAAVWRFEAIVKPEPASPHDLITEIIRLLLTPESLRCSSLDINPNDVVEDNAVMFPGGKDIDPVSTFVTTGAPLHLEEERNPDIREQYWDRD